MTPFTDEDLKRLKENGYQLFGYSTEQLEALIRRLEAAEKVCGMVDTVGALDHYAVVLQAWDAWRTAAGK